MLWEASLTVTIQVRLCPDLASHWKARLHASEGLKAINDSSLSDTFLTFALLVKQLKIEKEADGISHGLRFNNAAYNASMHRAAVGVAFLMSNEPHFENAVGKLELDFGRELLSNAYSKLNRLVQLSKQVATDARSAQSVAGWLVGMLHLALKMKLVNPKQTTDVWLFGDRKHGSSGFWQASLMVLEAWS